MRTIFLFVSRHSSFLLIGVSLLLSKLFFIILPYQVSGQNYFTFNDSYYFTSLLVLLGGLGIDFAVAQSKMESKKIILVLFIQILLVITFFLLTKIEPLSYDILVVALAAFFSLLIGVYSFSLLYNGIVVSFFVIQVSVFIASILSIQFNKIIAIGIFSYYTLGLCIVAIMAHILYKKKMTSVFVDFPLLDFYKYAISAFLINSAFSFGAILDKYFVTTFYNPAIANSYIFVWSVSVPLLYFGNLIERVIYAEHTKQDKNVLAKKSFVLAVVASVIYGLGIILLTHYFPGIIPASVDKLFFYKIVIYILPILGVYSAVQFPLNGILFSFFQNKIQNKIASAHFIIIVVFLLILYIIFLNHGFRDITTQIFLFSSYYFSLLFIKAFIVQRVGKKAVQVF